jgi:hypothetical protein
MLAAQLTTTPMTPVPGLETKCGRGIGLAACPILPMLVTSNRDRNSLTLFSLPKGASADAASAGGGSCGSGGGGGSGGLTRVYTLGGTSSPPMQFKFSEGGGRLAFMGPASTRLLLLTDAGLDAVHVIDIVGRVHVGYLAPPGLIEGPRGVAARGSLVAVSAFISGDSGCHVVHLFEGSGTNWRPLRKIGDLFRSPGGADGQLCTPSGLRFTGDGAGLVLADTGNNRLSLFRVADGSFVRHIAEDLSDPRDVEECEGGWLLACYEAHVEFVGVGGDGVHTVRARLGTQGTGVGHFAGPTALALVPGLGLVVREWDNKRIQVFQ